MTTTPGGTPFGDEISEATCYPATDHQELDQIGRGFMKYLIRLIVSVIVSSARVRGQIFNAIICNPRFGDIVTEKARTGLAEELRVRNIIVHEVDMTNIRFEPIHVSRRMAVGSSRIAMLIGAIVGFFVGVWAMTVIDATPVAVNVASQTASVGIAQAVDKPWFIAAVLVITTLIGICIGNMKQRYDDVQIMVGARAVYVADMDEEREEPEEH